MLLVEIRFIHYSPKDSESGVKEWVVATDAEQALAYIDAECLYGELTEDGDEEEASFYAEDCWWDQNPGKRESLAAAGLSAGEDGDVSGPAKAMTRWLEATTWKDVSDAYYGVTHWGWRRRMEISEAEASVLFRLGVAKDIRGWKPEVPPC